MGGFHTPVPGSGLKQEYVSILFKSEVLFLPRYSVNLCFFRDSLSDGVTDNQFRHQGKTHESGVGIFHAAEQE